MTCEQQRVWCTPNDAGLPGLTFEELAAALTPFLPSAGGVVKQIVNSTLGNAFTANTNIPLDDTIPQQTEGDEVFTATITPTSADSSLLITVQLSMSTGVIANFVTSALFQDAGANAIRATGSVISAASTMASHVIQHLIAPIGSTTPTTFKVRIGGSSGVCHVNADTSGFRVYGGVSSSNITIIEF